MSGNEEHFRGLERMYLEGASINRFFEPEIRIREGEAEIRIAVAPKFFHAAGAVHGSVYFKAMDDAAFFAANSVGTSSIFASNRDQELCADRRQESLILGRILDTFLAPL